MAGSVSMRAGDGGSSPWPVAGLRAAVPGRRLAAPSQAAPGTQPPPFMAGEGALRDRHAAAGCARGVETLPAGFTDTTVFSGLTNPTNVRFASDGRVFVAEKSGLLVVFDSLADQTPDGRRRPAHAGGRLLGPRPARARARPELPDQPVRVPPLHGRRPAGRHDPDLERRLPVTARADDGRLRRERQARPDPAVGRHVTRVAAGADQRPVVPAVPEPLDRRSQLRAGRRPVRRAAATARASTTSTTASRAGARARRRSRTRAAIPRPAQAGRRRRPRPRAAPCAARASAGRAASRSLLNGAVIRIDPATGLAAAGNPNSGSARRQREADRRLRIPEPVPLHLPAGDERAVGRRRRLRTPGRRSTA